VKKLILVTLLILGVAFIACDKQRALDSILADAEAKSYLLGQMLQDETTRAEMADSTFADTGLMIAFFENMASDETTREQLLQYIIAADSTGEWISAKLADNPEIKKAMRSAIRR
jgi:hypothetical protein